MAVLAHPSISLPESIIEQLVAYGLDGIEVFHPSHKPAQMEYYDQLADRQWPDQVGRIRQPRR